MDILSRVEGTIKSYSFTSYSIAAARKPLSFEVYKEWLNEGLHGDMKYLEEHLAQKQHLDQVLPKSQSSIVIIENYFPHPLPADEDFPLKSLRIAKYAQGEDYHFWLQKRLQNLADELKEKFPDHEFLPCTDSKPIMERDLAYQSGLGWVGKNTCLINQKKGSFFFIGEILTSLPLKSDHVEPHPDMCGTCNRCIEACPTQAILPGKKLDATKCIAYWNIESKSLAPQSLRSKIGDWIFGCDICQDVCPWNQKVFKTNFEPAKQIKTELVKDLRWILTNSNKHLARQLHFTPLNRAGARGLKRNAMIVAANLKLTELLPEIENYQSHESLGEVSKWTIEQLT